MALRQVWVLGHQLPNGHLGGAEELAIHVGDLLLAARAIGFLIARHFLTTKTRETVTRTSLLYQYSNYFVDVNKLTVYFKAGAA